MYYINICKFIDSFLNDQGIINGFLFIKLEKMISLVFIYRIINALFVNTYFNPDEVRLLVTVFLLVSLYNSRPSPRC